MSADLFDHLPEEVKRYIALMRLLGAQEEAHALTAEQVNKLVGADRELHDRYRAFVRDGQWPSDVAPLRVAWVVAEIQSRIARHHPHLAEETRRITGRSDPPADGVRRYLDLLAFLETKEHAGQLTAADVRSLVALDPHLHEQYRLMTTEGATVSIANVRANVTAEAIERQLALSHPDLAREFEQSTSRRR